MSAPLCQECKKRGTTRAATRQISGGRYLCTACWTTPLSPIPESGPETNPAAAPETPSPRQENPPVPKRGAVNEKEIVAMYKAGDSVNAIAGEVGSSWPAIKKLLVDAGVYNCGTNGRQPGSTNGTRPKKAAERPSVSAGLPAVLLEAIWRGLTEDQKRELIAGAGELLA